MPPKKKADAVPTEGDPEPGPPDEVDEEDPGTTTFHVTVHGVKNLPKDFETKVSVAGLCKEIRSAPAAASSSPCDWVFDRTVFIRQQGQPLYDDLVSKELTIKLKDATNFQIIGVATVDLSPLLHQQVEVGGDFTLVLTDGYRARWREGSDDPAVLTTPPPLDQTPRSTISVSVRVPEVVGPPEDTSCWAVTLKVGGVFALPPRMTSLGLGSTGDVETHQLSYTGKVLGIQLGDGALAKAAEERPPPPEEGEGGGAAEGGEDAAGESDSAPAKELTQAEFQEEAERFGLSVQFPSARQTTVYRGASFIHQFRTMLKDVGGVWLYFNPAEKPSTDPKKPNPAEVGLLARNCTGKAWWDLRHLMPSGVLRSGDCYSALISAGQPQALGEGSTLESSRAFVRLSLDLSLRAAAQPPPEKQVALQHLLPRRPPCAMFPSSGNAVALYKEAVERSFEEVARSTVHAGFRAGGVQSAIDLLRQAGTYEEMKRDVRSAVVQVCRERLRKDTAVVPGQALEGAARNAFMADAYSYLKGSMVEVLDDLRNRQPAAAEDSAAADQRGPMSNTPSFKALPTGSLAPPTPGARPREGQIVSAAAAGEQDANGVRRNSFGTRSKSPAGLSTPEGAQSPGGHLHGSRSRSVETLTGGQAGAPPPAPPVPVPLHSLAAEALAEGAGARRARDALAAVRDVSTRCQRLAAEAEMVGHWDRAAAFVQSRLVLAEFRDEPKAWIDYAKLCARTRRRQAASEEALRHAVQLLATGPRPHTPETALEVDLMLASLLLDRGRHEEAVAVFSQWHEKDFANPMYRFFLGLASFLADEQEDAAMYLESAGKPREWFQGLPDNDSVADKLKAFRAADGPPDPNIYARYLEKLLDFGLPSLVFTFIDQTGTLAEAALETEPLALLDAKASALDRDYAAAAARVERLLSAGEASREAWRLAGDCHYHLQDYDRALQALLMALSFEPKLEDPAVHVRLGHVLLLKKRWKQARDAFLKSINYLPTAEAWSGVAYAEYRSEELSNAYEALCEASLIDGERPDVWAQLVLVHRRLENWENADHCFQQCLEHKPDCDELLLEVSAEYTRREVRPALAEVAARSALAIRGSGAAHAALADALALDGRTKEAVLEAEEAVRLLVENPEQRKAIFDRALRWAEELADPSVAEKLHAAQRLADQEYAERSRLADERTAAAARAAS